MGTYTDHRDQYNMEGSPEGAKASPSIQDMELREEWQDEEFPRPLPEDSQGPEEEESPAANGRRPGPPTTLALSAGGGGVRKKRLAAPTLSVTLECSDSLNHSEVSGDEGFSAAGLSASQDNTPSLDINLEALDTPSDSESCYLPDSMQDLEWEDDLPRLGRGVGTVTSNPTEDREETASMDLDQMDSRGRRWRRFCISGQEYHVNMSVLEPYLQVLSHGGYFGEEMNAIITFSSLYLPENTVEDYKYVMDHLFRYIVGTLDLMVSENYVMVYLCGMAPRNKMPALKWLRQCYTCIDRRLKKDLKGLLVVHPAWYIKAIITLVKPFISDKFSRKIRFVHSLRELSDYIPMERLQIPQCIRDFDERISR